MSDHPELDAILAELRRVRDELAVKANLGKAEAKDQWTALEAKWQELERKAAPYEGVAKETAQNVAAALALAAGELKAGYERFRKLL